MLSCFEHGCIVTVAALQQSPHLSNECLPQFYASVNSAL